MNHVVRIVPMPLIPPFIYINHKVSSMGGEIDPTGISHSGIPVCKGGRLPLDLCFREIWVHHGRESLAVGVCGGLLITVGQEVE